MQRRTFLTLGLVALALTSGTVAQAGLAEYVKTQPTEFSWTKQGETVTGTVKIINLKVKSQVWRDIPWEHAVQIFVPQKLTYPQTALLYVTGGNPSFSGTVLGASVAPRVEAPVVVLYNIPNQPLFNMKEDDLIAHTFQQYLNSGDDTWPLLFPMVKAATRTMDAVQALSRQEWASPVEDFVVTGASKRGWTTYLTGATDSRVRAIAPMVFDNLKFHAQMPRQVELWGKYSEQIDDYTRRGLQQQMEGEKGRKLTAMVDPWHYRKKLTMPKLLVHGANDRYWATDATRLYWDDLPGEKSLLSIPNAGHGLEDQNRLLNTIGAFFHTVAAGKKMPELTLKEKSSKDKIRLRARSEEGPKTVRLWVVRADDLDFRPLKWEATVMVRDGHNWEAEIEKPRAGGVAVFAEAEYERDGRTFTISTPSRVYGKRPQQVAGSPAFTPESRRR